jgi:hypothetical protein
VRGDPIYGGLLSCRPLRQFRSGADGDGPVIVAVPGVRVVEVSVDEIVHVVPVGNLLVTTIRAVKMRRLMTAAGVLGGAISRVG